MVKTLKELHNQNSTITVTSSDALLPLSVRTSDYVEKVAMHTTTYYELFEKEGRPSQSRRRLSIVKISVNGKKPIWRVADTKGVSGIGKDEIGLPFPSLWEMDVTIPCAVEIEVGCFLPFYWFHPNHAARISTRIGLCSILISLVGVVVGIIC